MANQLTRLAAASNGQPVNQAGSSKQAILKELRLVPDFV
jgi:hypothetical protein